MGHRNALRASARRAPSLLPALGVALGLSVGAAATSARADTLQVAVDIAPLHGLVARVMGDLGTPALILPQGASPHDHALRPSEARALQGADLVFWTSEDLTPWLARMVKSLPEGRVLPPMMDRDGSIALPSREVALFGADDHAHADDDHAHADDDHDHAHDDHDGKAHHSDDHAHGATDPHGWLDPDNATAWLGMIAEDLAAADPAHSETYRANAAQGQAEIAAAAAKTAARLAGMGDISYVVFHDAYQYFEARFGLAPLGAIALSDASAPGPAHLRALKADIAEANAVCIFAEPQYDPGLVRTVAEGSGANVAMLDPLGQGIEPGPGLYPALLDSLGAAIAGCAETG